MAKKVKKAAKKATKKAPAKKAAKKVVKKAVKKAAKKAIVKKVAKKVVKKVAKKAAKKTKRVPNAGFMAALTASPALENVIGSAPLPRTEIIRKIWDYIKKNKLQDNVNRRMINADDKLKVLFAGKTQISMFDLAKVVSANVK